MLAAVVADHGVLAAHDTRALDDLTIYGDVLDATNRSTRERGVIKSVLRVRIMNLSVATDIVGVVLHDSTASRLVRGNADNKGASPFHLVVYRDNLTGEL